MYYIESVSQNFLDWPHYALKRYIALCPMGWSRVDLMRINVVSL